MWYVSIFCLEADDGNNHKNCRHYLPIACYVKDPENIQRAEIAEKLDYYGAWLELSSSAEYAYITLYSLNKYFAETLDVLESIIKEPLFPEKELGTVIDANIQQYQVNASKVDFLAHRSLLRALYGEEHPCGRYVEETDYHHIHSGFITRVL